MIQLQLLNKVLASKDDSIITDNMLTVEHFPSFADEFKFIEEHKEKYGNIPDKDTMKSRFPEFQFMEVTESDKYLIDAIQEEYLYSKTVPVIQNMANLLDTDSNAAAEYLLSELPNLQPHYHIGGIDIIQHAQERYDDYIMRKNSREKLFFETGFPELDDILNGLQRGEELFVILARTNQGKSWILEYICAHVWKTGFNVGYFSPEMSPATVGFRFDTIIRNFSNRDLTRGNGDDRAYQEHINNLRLHDNKFMVTTPVDFDRDVTISKIRNWVKQYHLDMIAIDGISYIRDERGHRNDSKTISLSNISEDLMELSVELKIPILVVVQANRTGVVDKESDGTPELESIRDSDAIAHIASKLIAIRQKTDNVLEIGIKKHRQGSGVGSSLNYTWDIDTCSFTYNPSSNDVQPRKRENRDSVKKTYSDKTDVF